MPTDPQAARTIRVATRRSPLATAQAGQFAHALAERIGTPVELLPVTTTGDVHTTTPLTDLGGVGVFVGAVRDALRDGRAQLGVHSLKDLPTDQPSDLVIIATPTREDPRDALCSKGFQLSELPTNARVGTGSPRRSAQLKAVRPDLQIVDLRGNVDTRLAKVTNADLDAVVLASAGLLRLNRGDAITEALDVDVMVPAPGQGALAVEVSAELSVTDPELAQTLSDLDDPNTRAAVVAERAVLATLEAGCSAPVGALATVIQGQLKLTARVVASDGATVLTEQVTGDPAAADSLGTGLASRLLEQGAADLMGEQ